MRIRILAVGTRMPAWVVSGAAEYLKRMPPAVAVEFVEIPLASRRNRPVGRAVEQEGDRILSALKPDDHVVALEVAGSAWSTLKLSEQLDQWRMKGCNVALLVGGPDGLSNRCRQRADQSWSLSPLTLPHPLVRVILAEQLYRAWTITSHHPYHR